jgi:hypothetical protein
VSLTCDRQVYRIDSERPIITARAEFQFSGSYSFASRNSFRSDNLWLIKVMVNVTFVNGFGGSGF